MAREVGVSMAGGKSVGNTFNNDTLLILAAGSTGSSSTSVASSTATSTSATYVVHR
jgi:hypothetical protein